MITRIVVLLLLATSTTIKAADEDLDDVTVETVDETPASDIPYESPKPSDDSKVYFAEHFDDPARFERRWVRSKAKKEGISEDIAKYDGEWVLESPRRDGLTGDLGLVLKSKAKHSAIASRLPKPFVFADKPLIVQYEVLLQDGQECGGAYLKLLTSGGNANDLEQFHDKTPYSIMFGPDKCGNDHKLHFIFNHKNPNNGSVEEKHCKKPKERLEEFFADRLPHLYTLIIRPDNTFEMLVDHKVVNSGSLLEDFTPAVNPPAEVDDPNDKKPEDWDEREKIPDPELKKPDDWDEDAPAQIVDESAVMPKGWLVNEPKHIPDPDAKRPDDWDTDMDGEWEPPLIDNPACVGAVGCGPWEPPLINNPAFKGKWRAPLVDNPNYKGKWRPRKIPNPDYFEDKQPFKMQPVEAIGFELWTMSKDILFDNIIITDEYVVAERWAVDSFEKKRQKIAKESVTLWGRMLRAMNYRPKSWAIYFIYCAIPVLFYIRHLWLYVQEESVIQKVVNLTNEYPALWILYIVILVAIVHLVLVVCRKPSRTLTQAEEEQRKTDAEKKKTDEVTEDDKNKPLIEEVEVPPKGEGEDDQDAEKHSNPSSDEEEEGEEIEVEQLEESEPKEGTRKRKVRKE